MITQGSCPHALSVNIMTAFQLLRIRMLVRALQLRLVLQQSVVCAPCDQAVHRSAFRLACEETLS